MERLVKTILSNCIKKEIVSNTSLHDINFKDPQSLLPLKNIYFGANVEITKAELHFSERDLKYFQIKCLDFYIELVTQIYNRYDFKNAILSNLMMLDPINVVEQKNRSIAKLVNLFPNLFEKDRIQEIDSEWQELQCLDFKGFDIDNAEMFWKEVLLTKRGDGTVAFPMLKKFIFELLSLPNSSAADRPF